MNSRRAALDAGESYLVFVQSKPGAGKRPSLHSVFAHAHPETDLHTGIYLFADLYSRDYRAVGRHLYIDVAIVDPTGKSALDASPSSAVEVGAAAKAKVGSKWGKYRGAVEAVSGVFRAAVVERFGAMSCEMQGLLRMMAGDADRDLRAADDWSFAAQSRRAYFEQHAVFAAVMADAAMLDAVIGVDGEYGDVRDGGAGG